MSSNSSWISSTEIANIIERLRHQQYRDSTRKNYYAVWKVFSDFFVKLDFRPHLWEDRLTLFVGYLIDNKRQSSTVKSYVSAIKAVLRMVSRLLRINIYWHHLSGLSELKMIK